jgi:predicted ATPase/class 3 adenylate cyclase
MHNLIPNFIIDKFTNEEHSGKLQASTVFIDISGFTVMTQELMKNGKEGAEVLNDILNNIFEQVIDAVYDRGGFISTFAGDAFTAIFPDTKHPLNSCHAATAIRQIFRDIGKQETRFGKFELSVKIGLSFGRVDWGIVGYEKRKTYFFRGPAIDNCARAEHRCDKMKIVVHKGLLTKVADDVKSDQINKAYSFLVKITSQEKELKPSTKPTSIKKIVNKFLPKSVTEYRQKGEFRDIAVAFVSFKEPTDLKDLDLFTGKVLETSDNYGGYFEGLDFGDKGGNFLVIFGAPISYENNIERAVNFINEIRKDYKDQIRAGITTGTVFAGLKGSEQRAIYGVIGEIVNLSARFMMKAAWGETLLSKPVNRKIEAIFRTIRLHPRKVKGYEKRIVPYRLAEEKGVRKVTFFANEMVGRRKELTQLRRHLKPIRNGKFGGIVYLYGSPGIGKSRLIYELIRSSKIRAFTFQCDSILKNSLNPFAYFLNDYFKQTASPSLDDRKRTFENIYNDIVKTYGKDHTQELHRIKSIIGSVIGLHWEGSIYSMIAVRDKPTVINFAINSFIKVLCSSEPLILLIEDIQWIDDASQGALQILTRQIRDVPFIILASGRYNDDGSKPVLRKDDDVKVGEITLFELEMESIEALVENSLLQKPNVELTKYIQSRTEGNPFYIEQFCLYLKEKDLLVLDGELISLTSEPVEIPVGVNAVILARIDRLSDYLKNTIQVASVLGREFELQVLKELINLLSQTETGNLPLLKKEDVNAVVSKCENEKIWSALSELRYIFSHSLLCDAVYGMQLKSRLRDLHKLAGDSIVNIFPDEKEKYAEIAFHYEQAEDWEKSGEYCVKAGGYFNDSCRYSEASLYYQKALSIAERIYSSDHPYVVNILNYLGNIYHAQGFYDKAGTLFERALKISERVLGTEDRLTAGIMNNLAYLLGSKGDFDSAESLHRRALEIGEKVLGKDHKHTANSLNDLALLLHAKGNYDNAEPLSRRALEIQEKVLGKNHRYTATTLNTLAMMLNAKGDYDAAEPLYRRALKIFEKVLGKDHPDTATSMNNLARLLGKKGDYEEAIPLYRMALEIKEKVLGKDHPDTAIALNNLARLLSEKGDHDGAESMCRRALKIDEKILGKNHSGTATSMNNLAVLLAKKGDFDSAEPMYRRALEIKEKVLGKNHPQIAQFLSNLARLLHAKGNNNSAESLLRRALALREKVLGKDHPDTAESLNNLAKVLYTIGDHESAESFYQRAINIWNKNLPDHPAYANALEGYSKLLENTSRQEEADQMRKKAQAIRDKNAQ